MRPFARLPILVGLWCLAAAPAARARPPGRADVIAGRDLAVRSNGVADGEAWVLNENGYAGAYIRVERAGAVKLTVGASGIGDKGEGPRMAVAVADDARRFEIGARPADYTATFELPEGSYFARVDFVNAVPGTHRELHVQRLGVTGAKALPDGSDARALEAAATYVRHFRRGTAKVALPGARPGTPAHARLVRHAFNFGVNIPYATNKMIPLRAEPGSDAARYQRMVLDHFNTVVLSNGGKWLYNEETRGQVKMDYVDRFLDFAEEHGLRVRMHNMLWDTEQQPAWVVGEDKAHPGLLVRARRGDDKARAELTTEIDERIDYYVRQRARRYLELDVVNESVHRAGYWQVYGARGFADLFNRTAAAVKAGGGQTRLYLNEYDVMQSSTDPLGGGADPFGNWYRRHADDILRAGGALSGLGVQYYVDGRPAAEVGSDAHSPARIAAVMHNLAGTGLRLSLTEFAVNKSNPPPERVADIVEETMRMVFGMPQMDSFLIWAIWPHAAAPPAPASILFDEAGDPTAAGRRYEAVMKEWSTDVTIPVAADGTVALTGFYGDYEITAGGATSCFSLVKGTALAEAGKCPGAAQSPMR
jgi:GH35 family endo-1,4-beta-xylanase